MRALKNSWALMRRLSGSSVPVPESDFDDRITSPDICKLSPTGFCHHNNENDTTPYRRSSSGFVESAAVPSSISSSKLLDVKEQSASTLSLTLTKDLNNSYGGEALSFSRENHASTRSNKSVMHHKVSWGSASTAAGAITPMGPTIGPIGSGLGSMVLRRTFQVETRK